MSSRLRQLPLALLALIAVLALGACGDSHTKVTTGTYAGESGANAPYLDIGPLKYEVQLSRQLNPANSEDSGYLVGLTPAQRQLLPGQEWFGVFIQVYNETDTPLLSAHELTISDTQSNVYRPIVPDLTNPYAYRATIVPPKERLPIADSTQAFGPTQGALLLFKIQTVSLDNRPLEFRIFDPLNPVLYSSAELDV